MRFHVLGLSHTQTTREWSCCAFTQKVRLLCKMLTDLGHIVYHYGTEGSDPHCMEQVDVLSVKDWKLDHGHRNWKIEGFNVDYSTNAHKKFVDKAINEIKRRIEPRDFILCTFGYAHQSIAEAFPQAIIVESGIGYPTTFAKFRVFESYAWMHYIYGTEKRDTSPQFYDCVIPNYLDLQDYEYKEDKEDFFLFVGRLNNYLKGAQIAEDVCKQLGVKLFLAGQGNLSAGCKGEHLGVLSIEERSYWMAKAKGFFCPTYYIEPFGTVNIESQACGTPVITTDFGAFTETVIQGETGFRCRTFKQFVEAAKNVGKISSKICRQNAERYSLEKISKMYDEYFQNLLIIHSDRKGWYSILGPKTLTVV